MDKKTSTTEQETMGRVSEKRRKLLKTAATTAPVIATLQSGAAFANASAHLCVNDSDNSTDTIDGVREDNTDAWVREEVNRYQMKDTSGALYWLYDLENKGVPAQGKGPYYLDEDVNPTDGQGDIIGSVPVNWMYTGIVEKRWVLVMYDVSMPGSVTEHGLHPKIFFDQGNNISGYKPLAESCLCSVDPGNDRCTLTP